MRGNESETCYSTLLTSYRRYSFLWTLRLGPRRYSLVLSVSRSALLVVTRRHLLRSTLPVSLYIYYFPRRYSRSLGDTRFVSLRVARSSSVTCFSLRSLLVSSFFFSCLRIHDYKLPNLALLASFVDSRDVTRFFRMCSLGATRLATHLSRILCQTYAYLVLGVELTLFLKQAQ